MRVKLPAMSVDRFVQLGFWLLVFPFALFIGCIALGSPGLVRLFFPYLILMRFAMALIGRFDTLDTEAPLILSGVLFQSLIYGLVIILMEKRMRALSLLAGAHLIAFVTTVVIAWYYMTGQ
jgi:hypothetical protein